MIEKFLTGVEGLDRITDGGFLRGSAYILQGPPGAGKTILANQFCCSHVRAGGRAIFMSLLSETHERLLAYMEEMQFFDRSAVPGQLQYVSGYGTLEREGLPGLLKLVSHEIKRHRATVVVLDGLFVAQSNVSDADFRKFIHELQGVAAFTNAVLILLTHQTRDIGSPEHTMVDGWIELSTEVKSFRSYRTIEVRKHRGSRVLNGKHQFRITDQGVVIFPRIETSLDAVPSEKAGTRRIATGVRDLDRMLNGGVSEASATLVLGPTGSGKTTLGLHFLSQSTPEEPGLMLGFYETPARLGRKAAAIGLDLDQAMRTGAVRMIWRPPSDNLVDELAWEVATVARQHAIKRVFVDGVAAIRDNLIAAERLPHVLNALNSHLREIDAAALYTLESRQLHAPETLQTDEVSMIVDNVLVLSYLREAKALRRVLSVIKLRESDFDPRVQEFHVAEQGIVFGPSPTLIRTEGT